MKRWNKVIYLFLIMNYIAGYCCYQDDLEFYIEMKEGVQKKEEVIAKFWLKNNGNKPHNVLKLIYPPAQGQPFGYQVLNIMMMDMIYKCYVDYEDVHYIPKSIRKENFTLLNPGDESGLLINFGKLFKMERSGIYIVFSNYTNYLDMTINGIPSWKGTIRSEKVIKIIYDKDQGIYQMNYDDYEKYSYLLKDNLKKCDF